jgi:hypothetical protein
MIVVGIVLSLCLPILFFTMRSAPRLESECSELSDAQPVCLSHHTVWFYPLQVSPTTPYLMWLAGISGILLTALGLLKRTPLVVRVVAVVIVLAFGWQSLVYVFVSGMAGPYFRHSNSITAHGKYYHLVEAKIPDGPRYEIVLGCDALGVRCEELVVAGGMSGTSVDFPAFVSQLP